MLVYLWESRSSERKCVDILLCIRDRTHFEAIGILLKMGALNIYIDGFRTPLDICVL